MVSHSSSSTPPAIVIQFIEAVNAGDLSRLLAVFSGDAIVNDQLQQWRGLAELRDWAQRDVIDQRLSLRVTQCSPHYGHCIVTAHADGNFDKRGLPDPLQVLLYFTLTEKEIVQLIILRDRFGASSFECVSDGPA